MSMEALFNQQGHFSVLHFDNVVRAFYAGDMTTAQPVLTAFQQHPDSWQVADQILEGSHVLQAKFIALQVLGKFIASRWKHLAQEQRLTIRNYIGSVIVSRSSNEATMQTEKAYLSKLNMVLVEIVKKEWPEEWPTFINEMVSSAHANLSLCENNLVILRLLSEDIFEASEELQAAWKTRRLKDQMVTDFGPVIELCHEVLSNRPSKKLVETTLESLSCFLKWMPPNVIFDTDLMPVLCSQIPSNAERAQRVDIMALKCCTEIAGRQDFPQKFQQKLVVLIQGVKHTIREMISMNGDITGLYRNENLNGEDIMYNYTLFVTTSLSCHGEAVAALDVQLLQQLHQDLLVLSTLDDDMEIWRMCAEYWVYLSSDKCSYMKQCNYIFRELRRITIGRIPNPDNVLLIDEEEDGIISREFVESSENPETFKITKHLLCNLVRMDVENDTESALRERLARNQTDSFVQWWKNLCQVSWSMGAIVGVLDPTQEFQLVNQCLADLDHVCVNSSDRIESIEPCILYIFSQYPNVLYQRQDLFSKVIGLVNKYLHDKETSIQKFAAHALVEICQGIRNNQALVRQDGGTMFLQDLLVHLPSLTMDLDVYQTCQVYHAIGCVLLTAPGHHEQHMQKLMDGLNQTLKMALYQTQQVESERLKTLTDVLRVNLAVCNSVNDIYESQLKEIYQELLTAYRFASEAGSNPLSNNFRERIKEQICLLLQTYIKSKHSISGNDQNLISPLLQEFVSSPPNKNDVSDIFATLIEKHLGNGEANVINEQLVRSVLEIAYFHVFERIYTEIKPDFASFYEKRSGFFRLVQAFIAYAFHELSTLLQEDKFTLIVDSILWGIQHPSHELSNQALEICSILLNRIAQVEDEDQQNALYSLYYMKILDIILHTITDYDRRTQFELQSQILAHLLELVQQGEIYTRLYPEGIGSNADYVQEHVRSKLMEIYPSLPQNQIDLVAQGMLEYSDDIARFRQDLIDFMADFRSSDDFSNDVILDQQTELELLGSLTR
ncbi:armadillo-type protein [Zychaea mexicana]|uniref:armadillo-type protein n=1 Tax=Zychaea mexicana TaxID=64656 RepID=UPI0022FF1FF9|nr:armadillo-type protein [Zychaea mexicana]KAI9497130.1 armadillo-type protein [Zychaea mexicana]